MGTNRNTVLAGLMCIALAACSTTDSGTSMSGESYGSSATGTTSQSTAMATPGVVVLIETIPRGQAGTMDNPASGTTSQSGTSGTAGVTGSSSDVAYRITVRLDDGTTRVMTQQAAPSFQTGDRVRMGSDGVLQRY